MCSLFKMRAGVDELRRIFGPFAGDTGNLPPFDAIYPGRDAPVLRRDGHAARLELMGWGVPPPPGRSSRPVINVRNLDSPFWRPMLGSPERRCLVPATAFAEYAGEPGAKRKVWFSLRSGQPFAFAGLWRPTGDGPRMAFLTCEPNPLVGAVHPRAMPVILPEDAREAWLLGGPEEVRALARPFPADGMRADAE